MIARKTKTCVTCCAQLHGRKDKVYCSDDCKNEHHRLARILSNKIKKDGYSNKMIVRNYVILLGLFRTHKKKIHVHRNHLLKYGFDPKSALNKRARNGCIYYEIGEFLFREGKNGILEITRTTIDESVLFEEFITRWAVEFPDDFERKFGVNNDGITVYFQLIHCLGDSALTVKVLKALTYSTKQRDKNL